MSMHLPRKIYNEDHEQFRATVRRFFAEEIVPRRDEFEKAGMVDRATWLKAGELGLLGITLPEEYGGSGLDRSFAALVIEEQARAGLSGPSIMIHSYIVMNYLLNYGTEEQKRYWLPKGISGEAIMAIGMTEPEVGSDLQSVRMTAHRDGDEYVINGSKIFITNGITADMVVMVCKTDPTLGAKGISLILVETNRPGFNKGRNLNKLGMKLQDTAELFLDNVRVPVSNLLGNEGQGFIQLMLELTWERVQSAIWCVATCEKAVEDTVAYTRERRAFGQKIFDYQNTRFKLADLATETEIARVFVDRCIEQMLEGELDSATASMAKYWTSEVQGRVMDECVQLFGGYGYMWEYDICRSFADARVNRIWGGTTEIMKEIIARKLP